nr:MAG TPA: protein of unknown function (DUF5444) [Caudoviricetes sp.]
MVICPVDSTITEQRNSRLVDLLPFGNPALFLRLCRQLNRRYTSHSSLERRATFHFNGTEKSIPSAYHLSSSTVDVNVLTHFEKVLKMVSTGYNLYPFT